MPVIWTQEDIDALKNALKSGVKKVRYEGPPAREQEYQSLAEMRDLLAEMTADVNGTTTYRRVQFSKGFRDGC